MHPFRTIVSKSLIGALASPLPMVMALVAKISRFELRFGIICGELASISKLGGDRRWKRLNEDNFTLRCASNPNLAIHRSKGGMVTRQNLKIRLSQSLVRFELLSFKNRWGTKERSARYAEKGSEYQIFVREKKRETAEPVTCAMRNHCAKVAAKAMA